MGSTNHRHARRSRRRNRLRKEFGWQWLLVLLARTLATIIVALVTRWLRSTCGG